MAQKDKSRVIPNAGAPTQRAVPGKDENLKILFSRALELLRQFDNVVLSTGRNAYK
jgi:hypothetical protein